METTATSKGQIVIPSSIRKKLGIVTGTRIRIEVNEENNEIILKPITRGYVLSFRTKFKGRGLLDAFRSERAKERSPDAS
jgi:AbrB family looped-hinge helix DNA binding protein